VAKVGNIVEFWESFNCEGCVTNCTFSFVLVLPLTLKGVNDKRTMADNSFYIPFTNSAKGKHQTKNYFQKLQNSNI
jgi:hypothetical protein